MEDDYTKWRNLIGDFMLTFAEIERELNDLLCDLSSGKEYEEVMTMQFKARQSRAKALVNTKVQDMRLVERANAHLDRLLNFAENERNLIAHNPLDLSLESVFEDMPYFEIRSQRRSDKHITYEKLEQKYRELQKCFSEFKIVCYRISLLLHP